MNRTYPDIYIPEAPRLTTGSASARQSQGELFALLPRSIPLFKQGPEDEASPTMH